MSLISSLEKRFGSWAIPNLAVYLIAIQTIGAVMLLGNYASLSDLFLHGSSVIHRGQWWRLLSFMMVPSVSLGGRLFLLWLLISFVIFYLIGSALEQRWGVFRFNLFILCGYLLTVAMAFVNPGVVIGNEYFLGCVFLAFATLFPNFELYLFFILPVKVKWLGWLTFVFYTFTLFQSTDGPAGIIVVGNKMGVIAAFANYGLFFGRDLLNNLKTARRRKSFQAQSTALAEEPRHACAVCGATDKAHPELHFRYCSTCGKCFCEKHISDHTH